MNGSIENQTGLLRKLETGHLENIPDYEKKLKAWEYAQDYYRLPEDQRGSLIGPTRDKYGTRNPGIARGLCGVINAKFKFPITEPSPNNDIVNYKDIDQIKDYFKDILDKNGEVLPSKHQQKAA